MTRPLARGRGRAAALVTAAVALDLVLFSTLLNTGESAGSPAVLVVAYALAGGAILLWQRHSMIPGYALLWLHAIGSVALTGYRPTLPLLVGLYWVAAQTALRPAVAALLASVGPIGLTVLDGVREAPPGEIVATVAGLSTLLVLVHCGVFAIGRWAGRVRARARALEQDRANAARDAVEDERVRIAAELHDIVGHSVTLMTVQAAGARKVMRRDPARADEALAQISGTGARTVSELRRMLGGLGAGEPTGLDGLDDLLDSVRGTGVTVTLCRQGTPGGLHPAVSLVAYRVVQEALTNVVRHAGPGTHATITLGWAPRAFTIDVSDDGHGGAADPAAGLSIGHGLAGLTARVAAVQGRFEARPGTSGGFRVCATLPAEPSGRAEPGESTIASEPSEHAVAHPAS